MKTWLKISDKIRFVIIGLINAIISYLIYVLFLFILGDKFYQLSLILSWVISSIFAFFLHRYFVFRTKGNLLKQYLKCASSWMVAYSINAFLLEFLVKYAQLNPYVSQIIANVTAGIFTFFAFKLFAFRKKD